MIHNFTLRLVLASALIGSTALVLHLREGHEIIPTPRPLSSFPQSVGSWQGSDVVIPQEVRDVLGQGDFLERSYRSAAQPDVDLFLAYFPTQRTGATIHSPKNCLPGSGWTPLESRYEMLSVPGRPPLRVNRYVIAKGLDRQLVLYWYQAHGRVVASEYWAKFYLVSDAMRLNRSDGALVRLVTPITQDGQAAAEARVLGFAQNLVPLLSPYIPN